MFLPQRFLSISLISIVVMVCLVSIERRLFGISYFSERMPETEPYNLWHAWVALSLSLAAIHGFTRDASCFGVPVLRLALRREFGVCIGSLALAVAVAVLFCLDADTFSALAREDNVFEWLSALLIFAASAFFAAAATGQLRAARGGAGRVAWLAAGGAGGFSLVLFVVGMEEISWMQRVFMIETPDALLALNKQQELNLHNISTGLSELIYYSGSFVLLTLAPFIWLYLRKGFSLGRLEAFAPSVLVLVASAPMAAFNSDNWSMLPTQMMVMMTVIILLVIADLALRSGLWREFVVLTATAILIVAIQQLFVLQAHKLVRIWDPTEYKELFIAFGLAIYGYQTWARLRALAPTAELPIGRRAIAG